MKKWYKYPVSCIIQKALCKIGIAIHNPFRDECTPDFSCCNPDLPNKHYWLKISAKQLPFRKCISYKESAPKGTPGRTFIKIVKYKWWFQN